MWRSVAILFGLLAPAAAGDVTFQETREHLILSGDSMELRVDRATGQLAELVHRPSAARILGGGRVSLLDIHADNAWIAGSDRPAGGPASSWRYVAHDLKTDGQVKRLSVRARARDWEVEGIYQLDPRGDMLARSAVFRYLGKGKPTVRGTRFCLASAWCGEGPNTFYEILSRWPPEQVRQGELVDGRGGYGAGSSLTGGFVGLHDPAHKLSLVAAFYSESELADLTVKEHKADIDLTHQQQVLDRPQPNRAIPSGTQYLRVVEGDWPQALAACRDLYARIGVRVPEAIAERAVKSVVYSCHPGGTIDSGFADVGHLRRLQQCLPRLERLGVNVVWLLPFYDGFVYAPLHYDRFDPRWADEASLRQFVEDAHGRGMKVLLDLVPHGPLPESRLQDRHRDWVSTTEDGRMLIWWGCLGCDYAHPGWQRFMADHAADWVRRCGVDGYRVDCAGGGPPNWAAADGRRPSQSGICGALGLLRDARSSMESVKKPVYLLAEAEGAGLNTVCEYTYPWTWFFQVLPALHAMPPEQWVPSALHWLQNQQHSLPEGASFIWFLENHDLPRTKLIWGPGTQRALLAFCAFARGAPFLYQEQQVGFEPLLRKLYAIRRSQPALTVGTADYVAVADDPRVMTIVRRHQDQVAVVAINFTGEPLRSRIRLPQNLLPSGLSGEPPAFVFRDLAAEPETQTAADSPIALEPWSCAVLLLQKPVAGEKPRRMGLRPVPDGLESPPAQPSPVEVETSGDRVALSNGVIKVVANAARGGLIDSLVLGKHKGSWIAGHELSEGPQKFRPGEPAFRISAARVNPRPAEQADRQAAICFDGAAGGVFETAVRYALNAASRLTATVRLTPLVDIPPTRAQLVTTLRLPRANAWAVRTLEGTLCDDLVQWRFDDVLRLGRYWHDTSRLYWESRLLPLSPDAGEGPAIFAIDQNTGEQLGIRAFASRPDLLQNIVLKLRDGSADQLTLQVEWLRGDRPVGFRKGQAVELSLELSLPTSSAVRNALRGVPGNGEAGPTADRAAPRAAPAGDSAEPALSGGYGNFVVSNSHYRMVLGRSDGGAVHSLRLKNAEKPILDHSMIYTDYGLYDAWRDPEEGEHRTNARNNGDCEPDVGIRREGEKLYVEFTGYFRHPGHPGAGVLEPRTQYRLQYGFDRSPSIRVEASVRPYMTLHDAKAFLAHTLGFPQARSWAAWGNEGGVKGNAAGAADRQWQSAAQPLNRPAIAIETAGGCCLLSDLTATPPLQNLFVLAGNRQATVFLAWLDGMPGEVRPVFRRMAYTLRPTAGTLETSVPDFARLKPWSNRPAQ